MGGEGRGGPPSVRGGGGEEGKGWVGGLPGPTATGRLGDGAAASGGTGMPTFLDPPEAAALPLLDPLSKGSAVLHVAERSIACLHVPG